VSPSFTSPIRRRRDGRYKIDLDPSVRNVLASLADQFAPVLRSGDDVTRRLYPPAYVGGEHEAEESAYRELVDDVLAEHHRNVLATLAATAHAKTIDREELEAWLGAIGTVRLVLGTRLDVTEEMDAPGGDDPDAPLFRVYEVLGALQELIVEAVAGDLPDEGTDPLTGLPA
jgi:hypothetical protein